MEHAPANPATPSLPRNVRLLIGMRASRSIGQGAMVAAFTLYLHALGWSATSIGAVLMGALLFGTLLTIIIGPLSDRGGRRAFLLGYDALQALVALIAMLTTTPWLLVTAAVIGGFGRGANGSAGPFSPVEQAWLAIELPMARRGRIFSANSAVGFIGMGIGALLAALPAWWMGHAMGASDYRLLFVLPLAGSLASFTLMWLAREPATYAQTRDKTARSFSTALAMMERYPNYRFMSSQPQLYAFLKQDHPEMGPGEIAGLARMEIQDPETDYELARKISQLQQLRSENFFMGNAIRGMLLNAYGWWLVGLVARVAGAALVGVGSVLGFVGFRRGRR